MIDNKKVLKIFYWSPFISKVATIKAVINSAYSLIKFGTNKYDVKIINAVGEWDEFSSILSKKKIKLINFHNSNLIKNKKRTGFFTSRLLYFYIIIKSIIPLFKIMSKNSDSFIIIHLITSLPLLLNLIFNFKLKIILRISGYPKMNNLRKFFWKIALKKILYISCPTTETRDYLISLNLTKNLNFFVLRDPVLDIFDINNNKNKEEDKDIEKFKDKPFSLSVGRLTKQKNFIFLIKCFMEIINKDPSQILLIIGDGEDKFNMLKLINKYNLQNNIYLLGYKKNIFEYMRIAKNIIIPSLWEDPGFVLIESCYFGKNIICSDCKSGPKEILNYGKNGILFKNNSKEDFIKKFYFLKGLNENELKIFKIKAKKISKNYTIFSHYKILSKYLI